MQARALIAALAPERARFLSLVRSRVAQDADAEDVLQRALLRAAERAGQLDDPLRARAWFYRILRHAIADHHRGARASAVEPSSDALADVPDERANEPRGNPCGCALRLLATVRPPYADVLRRVDLAAADPREVAAALGISTANLHVRLHRARRALQSRVRGHCGVTSHRPCLDCTCSPSSRCGPGPQ